jgi:tripeptide aminopeptidase
MKNAVRAAADFITRLPPDRLPETTEGRQPYLHPLAISGEVGKVVIKFILRAFTGNELAARGEEVQRIAAETQKEWPGVTFEVVVTESYRNMKVVLDRHPRVLGLALEAVRMAGVKPHEGYIRGGTDGSALSHKGIPTPNIFDGSLNYHGYRECVSLDWMVKSCETLRHLVYLWGKERSM